MKRTLTLRTERLAELTTGDLGAVVGAASGVPCQVQVELTKELCPSYGCTGYYPSIFDPCTTG